MDQTLKLLFLEDSLLDVELCVKELERAGYEVEYQVARSEEEFISYLEADQFDVVLADYNFPGFSGLDALREFRSRKHDRPFLIVSGSIGEETAVESIKAGANDYVLKDRLVRLPTAVQQAINAWRSAEREKQTKAALKETNNTLVTLIQASPLAILVLSADGKVRIWNRAAEQMLGWAASEVLDRRLPVVSGESRDELAAACELALKGESVVNVETRWRNKHNVELEISLSTAPLRDTEGRVSSIVAIAADITERKQAELARLAMERHLDEAKRQFYRETILAVTDGKLEIIEASEVHQALEGAQFHCDLSNTSQLSPTRQSVRDSVNNVG